MKHKLASLIPLVIGAVLLPLTSQAQLKITEVQSAENKSSKPDWFELTNLGNSPVDITGYTMDDSSHDFSLSVALLDVTSINSGESVIFFEATSPSVFSSLDFRNWWGLNLNSSVQIGTYIGSLNGVGTGVGLSKDGDEVNIYNSSGVLVDKAVFGVATAGTTFNWDPTTFLGLSSVGVNGGFAAAQNGDIGSPGVAIVPEPSLFALFGLALGGILFRQTSKRRK